MFSDEVPLHLFLSRYEVQWSQQEAIVARRYMDMHERSIHTTGYVDTRINPKVPFSFVGWWGGSGWNRASEWLMAHFCPMGESPLFVEKKLLRSSVVFP